MVKFVLFLFISLLHLKVASQIVGCTDPLATNYNSSATTNDGSCTYSPSTISPIASYTLNSSLNETSGLIFWNDTLYTHNDNTDKRLYALDSTNGTIVNTYSLASLTNIDWEEVSQDSFYVYIGDFGNNASGNRTNLRIYKIDKASILNNSPIIDTIKFSYSNQTTYTATGSNNTDFDCEAFIVTSDSIFLFTKQWVSKKTSLYSLPKIAGAYTANYLSTLDVQGLITGATYITNKKIIALCGYSTLLQPFFYLLYDFNGNKFFSANKRKINMALSFYQTEGITSKNGLKYFVSNEYFSQSPIFVPQQLSIFDLSTYLSNYAYPTSIYEDHINADQEVIMYPSITDSELTITNYNCKGYTHFTLTDIASNMISKGELYDDLTKLNLNQLSRGVYLITLYSDEIKKTFRLIKN